MITNSTCINQIGYTSICSAIDFKTWNLDGISCEIQIDNNLSETVVFVCSEIMFARIFSPQAQQIKSWWGRDELDSDIITEILANKQENALRYRYAERMCFNLCVLCWLCCFLLKICKQGNADGNIQKGQCLKQWHTIYVFIEKNLEQMMDQWQIGMVFGTKKCVELR